MSGNNLGRPLVGAVRCISVAVLARISPYAPNFVPIEVRGAG